MHRLQGAHTFAAGRTEDTGGVAFFCTYDFYSVIAYHSGKSDSAGVKHAFLRFFPGSKRTEIHGDHSAGQNSIGIGHLHIAGGYCPFKQFPGGGGIHQR